MTSFKSINIVHEVGMHQSWSNTLPFWVGIEGLPAYFPDDWWRLAKFEEKIMTVDLKIQFLSFEDHHFVIF